MLFVGFSLQISLGLEKEATTRFYLTQFLTTDYEQFFYFRKIELLCIINYFKLAEVIF